MIGIAVGTIVFIGGYKIYSDSILENIKTENDKALKSLNTTLEQTSLVNTDIKNLNTKTTEFKNKTLELEKLTNKVSEKAKSKNSIPNLLNKIARDIPQTVQVTSITNTNETHIIITAQAKEYDQLGMFKAKLIAMNVLSNVTSDSAVKQSGVVKVTIEGDLP